MSQSNSSRPWIALLPLGALFVGAGSLVLLAVADVVLIAPVAVRLAWDKLGLASAAGLPTIGFWGVLLGTSFLVLGTIGRLLVVLFVWMFDPSWLAGSAMLHWPQASWRTFLAFVLLFFVAQIPKHNHAERTVVDTRKHRWQSQTIDVLYVPRWND